MYNNNNKDYGDLIEQATNELPFTYEEFLDFLAGYKEVSFCYNGLQYGAGYGKFPGDENMTVTFFICGSVKETMVIYNGIDDFANNAKINGKLLKDIWSQVSNVYFLD